MFEKICATGYSASLRLYKLYAPRAGLRPAPHRPRRIDTAPILRRVASGHYDWVVIGSGFGGSVAALRLAEKGYRVAVLECGRRFADEDFAKSAWHLRRYFWMPRIGLRGIFRLTVFKDVFIVSGNGVGGGSLGYANTLYRARPAFFADRQWDGLAEWERELRPHYETAERMLGRRRLRGHDRRRRAAARSTASEIGVGDTFKHTRVGIFFGPPGEEVADPYFGGEGPPRTGCIRCAGCMIGCRYGAKNTLVKNYLWFAERLGVEVIPERQVTEIRPLGAADGSDGYEVATEHPGAWLRKRRRTLHRPRRGRRRRRPRHQQAARRVQAPRRPAAALRPARRTWCAPTASRSRR